MFFSCSESGSSNKNHPLEIQFIDGDSVIKRLVWSYVYSKKSDIIWRLNAQKIDNESNNFI